MDGTLPLDGMVKYKNFFTYLFGYLLPITEFLFEMLGN